MRAQPKRRDLVRLAVLSVAAVLSCSTLAVPAAPPPVPTPTVQVFPLASPTAAADFPAATVTPGDQFPIATPLPTRTPTPPPEPTATPTLRPTPDRPPIQKG